MRLSKLTQELALALEVASIQQAWGNPSPFQDKINELLVKAGRNPVTHLTQRAVDLPNESRECTCGGEDGHHPKSCGLRQSASH